MRVHFIGIGGIGVSALARFYLSNGAEVTGSDLASSEVTEDLEKLGAKISIGKNKKANMPRKVDLVIYSPAVQEDNVERQAAVDQGIPVKSYPEALGELTREFQTITVSGSHGKSTTTALVSLVLEEGYCDPTVIIGTRMQEFGNSNFRKGLGGYLVLEADEWNRSFLNYSPRYAVLTNIDAEHLDTYSDVHDVIAAFGEYLSKVPEHGLIVANHDDKNVRELVHRFHPRVVWYSLKDPEAEQVKKVLRVPGEHNLSNALAAYKLGRALGIRDGEILRALSRFNGTWRRFEFKGIKNGAYIFADYGHHPTEIQATLKAARQRFPLRRIWCVYQPHQHQRLLYLWDNFVGAFDMADVVCLLPVYDVAGRETTKAKKEVSSEKLAEALHARGKRVTHLTSHEKAKAYIESHARAGDVVLIMGAGDIYHLTHAV